MASPVGVWAFGKGVFEAADRWAAVRAALDVRGVINFILRGRWLEVCVPVPPRLPLLLLFLPPLSPTLLSPSSYLFPFPSLVHGPFLAHLARPFHLHSPLPLPPTFPRLLLFLRLPLALPLDSWPILAHLGPPWPTWAPGTRPSSNTREEKLH